MYKLYLLLLAFFLISNTAFTQVGINTTSPDPSTVLDVNGNMRVRTLGSGPIYSDANGNLTNSGPQVIAAGLVQANGTALKIFGATVSRTNLGDYQVTFATARPSANYIINLATIDCMDAGACDYDDPGITYYNRTTSGFAINIGDSDNGGTAKEDIDLEFTFSVIDF
ncbi:MAG: hypothetical protein CMC35_06940 [Flavobacteriaceae bacterium]|nr:hypothetical protein [Flavobacteriaceae bacterium]|tara:strand:- start:6881 stop:7384 length:504 start_codon:yes stop_codon:yes gene_type:complete